MVVCAFRLYAATLGWCVWCRCVCPAQVAAAPRHSWLGCWGVCVFVCSLRLYPASPGPSVRCGCVCLGSGSGYAPPILAGVLRDVCVCVRAPLVPHTLLAGVCGVGVCAWAWVSAAPRLSWLGCLGSCVFVCALCLYPATPGWGVRCGCVCLGFGFGCAPPLLAGMFGCVCVFVCTLRLVPCPSWLGVRCGGACLGLGLSCAPPLLAAVSGCVCVCVRAPLVPRHSWLGCAVWVCVLGLGFWLPPATPGSGVGVCVFVCVLRLYPATPDGVVCVFVCLGFACSLLFAGLGVGARGLLRAPRPFSAIFWSACLLGGGVRKVPWVRFAPPPPLLFFFPFRTGGVSGFRPCCVVVLWCPPLPVQVLGLLVSVPPFPLVRAAPMFFFLPVTAPVGCVSACPGCPFLSPRILWGPITP